MAQFLFVIHKRSRLCRERRKEAVRLSVPFVAVAGFVAGLGIRYVPHWCQVPRPRGPAGTGEVSAARGAPTGALAGW